MFKVIRFVIFVLIYICITAGGDKNKSNAKQKITEITFGLYPSDGPAQMSRQFIPLLQYLQQQLRKDNLSIIIKVQGYINYSEAIKALVAGKVDFVRFGSATYVMAKQQNPEIDLIAIEQENGEKKYKGVFIVKKDSPIDTINELEGKTIAFGNELSAIGRYLSQNELVKAGIDQDNLKKYNYLGRHDLVAKSVLSGKYEVGVVKENTFKAHSSGLKKIGAFSNVTNPWIARKGFPEELFNSLQKALLTLTPEKNEKILKFLKKDGFIETKDSDFDRIRKVIKESNKF